MRERRGREGGEIRREQRREREESRVGTHEMIFLLAVLKSHIYNFHPEED